MGIKKVQKVVEVLFCDFCHKEAQNLEVLDITLNGDRGEFELCHECSNLFYEKFFSEDADEIVGDPEEEYENEEDDLEDEPIGEPEDDYDLDDSFDEEEEIEEEPAPPPPPPRRKKKKVSKKKTSKKRTSRAAGKKKVNNKSRYSNPLAGINHGEEDGTRVSVDGTVSEGKVLRRIKKAALAERRGVIKRCPAGECEYDEDTGKCEHCGLRRNETGMIDGAAPAHDPIRANTSGDTAMDIDPYTGAYKFAVDVNSDKIQRRMKKNLRKQNEAVRKKYSKSGRYFNLDPTDGLGRGR